MANKTARQKAIARRRIFLSLCAVILIAVITLVVFTVNALLKASDGDKGSSDISAPSSSDGSSEAISSGSSSDTSSLPATGPHGLDANYSKLLLVNGEHPLAEDYDYEANLTTIPNEYLNNTWFQQIGGQIDKDVWPYMKAMIDDAWADGVELYVWSPYRSYNTQKDLFDNQVQRCIANGTPAGEQAEAEAATVVARPGTSEHHTGLAADFNMADDKFEQTDMYAWLQENAENYGFIMRYSAEKQPETGVIHESWHYRFVGINVAKEINDLDMCLEEYLEYKNIEG